MPYDNLSEAKKKHPNLSKYSEKAQRAWLSAFNSAWEQKKDEGYAFAVAYSAANKVDGKKGAKMDRKLIAAELVKIAKGIMAQYETLNDFAEFEPGLSPGRTEIWYQNDRFARDGMMGLKWLQEEGLVPSVQTLKRTHVYMGSIKETNLEKIFNMMQGENWSPRGEARNFVMKSGAHHTSMSVGDVVKIGSRAWIVDRMGFEELP